MEHKELIKKIENYLKNNVVNKFEYYDAFEEHINPVKNFAVKLAKIYKADKEVVEIAALLHDVAHMESHENHELVGVEIARKILKGKLPEEKIKLIVNCVKHHRGNYKRESIEEEIIFCADVMSHVSNFLNLVYSGGAGRGGLKETKERLKSEISWGWKKMKLPEARKMVEKKYKSINILLENGRN